MAGDQDGQRPNGDDGMDVPIIWDKASHRPNAGKDDHGCRRAEAEDERDLELLQDGRYLCEEGCVCRFLGRRAPGHVDAEEMGKDCLGDVERDTAKEYAEERYPFEILQHYVMLA